MFFFPRAVLLVKIISTTTKIDNGTKAVPNQIKKLINEYRYK
jgi:hypothetical protein